MPLVAGPRLQRPSLRWGKHPAPHIANTRGALTRAERRVGRADVGQRHGEVHVALALALQLELKLADAGLGGRRGWGEQGLGLDRARPRQGSCRAHGTVHERAKASLGLAQWKQPGSTW